MRALRFVTLDRVPVYTLILFILLSWVSTAFYLDHSVVTALDPFTPVWGAYTLEDAQRLIAWALAGLVLAALFPLPGVPTPWRALTSVIGRQVRALSWLWLLLTFGVMALLVIAKGKYLFVAPHYLEFVAPSAFVSAASVAQPIAILGAGFLSVRWPRTGRLAMFLWLVLLFASATRVFAGVVLLYVLGRFLAGGRVTWLAWVGVAVFTVVALPIPLFSRNLDSHGLFPYAQALWTVAQDPSFFASSLITTAQSFGFTVPLMIYVSHETGITASDMFISLNPGPGSMVGWDEIVSSMRVHYFIPYSALGEWASFGGLALMLFTLGWGLVVRLCMLAVSSNPHPTMVLFLTAVLGMSMLTVVMMTQYNTRSVARIISLMILAAVVDALTRPLTARLLGPTPTGSGRHRFMDPSLTKP